MARGYFLVKKAGVFSSAIVPTPTPLPPWDFQSWIDCCWLVHSFTHSLLRKPQGKPCHAPSGALAGTVQLDTHNSRFF